MKAVLTNLRPCLTREPENNPQNQQDDKTKFVDKICQQLEITYFSLEFEPDFWNSDKKISRKGHV